MFKAVLKFSDGEEVEDDERFETEEEAEEYGLVMLSNHNTGAEVLHMSNPGDYPLDAEDEDPEIEAVEVSTLVAHEKTRACNEEEHVATDGVDVASVGAGNPSRSRPGDRARSAADAMRVLAGVARPLSHPRPSAASRTRGSSRDRATGPGAPSRALD